MKKKLFLLGLFSVLGLSLGLVFSAPKQTNAAEEVTDDSLQVLLSNYYGDGTYKKDTTIYVDEAKIEEDLESYFHANVMVMERSTYYTKDALWMSRDKEKVGVKYSYYGTSYEGNATNGVTNATAEYPLVAPAKASKVLSGDNQNSMEEYYVTLDDFIQGNHTSAHTNDKTIVLNEDWSLDANGVYSNVNEDVLDGFRLFTAPLWLGKTEENANYISYEKATIQEVDAKLVMKLWVSSEEVGKLVDGVEADSEGNLLFSKAVISKKQADGLLQGKSENLQAGLGTDFEGYSPENPDHAKLFDVNSSLSVSKQGTWFTDNNGQKAYAAQSGYKIRLVQEADGNVALKIGGMSSDTEKLFRAGLNLTEEVCEPGTYVAKIRIKAGEGATIPQFFFKINEGSRTDSNVPLQYLKDGPTDSVTGFYYNNTAKDGTELDFEFDTEWKEYTTTFTIEEGSAVDNATSVCAAFVMYTSNKSANKEKDYLLIDDFEVYRVEDYGTDFEGFDSESHSALFPSLTSTITSGWKKDGNGKAAFGVQTNYQGCKLFQEEDGNNALMVWGSKEVVRVGIDVNDIIANPGVYKVSLKFKLGPNADNVSSILLRYHDKNKLTAANALHSTGFYFKKSTEDVGLSKDEWVTLETVIVITNEIQFSSDLCFVLMVFTNGNKTYGTETHAGNYVLVDDLQIEGYAFK